MTTNYARGAAFERRVKARLEADGWYVARSAGSKTSVDLVAVKDGRVLFIQCSLGKKSKRELMALKDLSEDKGARPVFVSKGMKFEFLGEEAA